MFAIFIHESGKIRLRTKAFFNLVTKVSIALNYQVLLVRIILTYEN